MAAVACILVAAAACESEEAEGPGEELVSSVEPVDPALLAALPEGATPEMLAEGRELYVVCSVCHGLDARGTALGPSLRDTTWIHIDGSVPEIVEITRRGVPQPAEFPIPMPVMGGGEFDEGQLQALATYVHAIGRSGE